MHRATYTYIMHEPAAGPKKLTHLGQLRIKLILELSTAGDVLIKRCLEGGKLRLAIDSRWLVRWHCELQWLLPVGTGTGSWLFVVVVRRVVEGRSGGTAAGAIEIGSPTPSLPLSLPAVATRSRLLDVGDCQNVCCGYQRAYYQCGVRYELVIPSLGTQYRGCKALETRKNEYLDSLIRTFVVL